MDEKLFDGVFGYGTHDTRLSPNTKVPDTIFDGLPSNKTQTVYKNSNEFLTSSLFYFFLKCKKSCNLTQLSKKKRMDKIHKLTPQEMNRVIDSCQTQYSMVQHQIESFDHFMRHMIPEIIRENSVICVVSERSESIHIIQLGNISTPKPMLEQGNTRRPIYPIEARNRRLTYSTNVYIDITHSVFGLPKVDESNFNLTDAVSQISTTTEIPDILVGHLREKNIYREVELCKLPVMVKSSFCWTSQSDSFELGEDPYDEGGYFIVNGNERTILMQEKMRINRAIVTEKPRDKKYTFSCEVRSLHEKRIRSTSTLYVMISRVTPYRVYVKLPFISQVMPLATLFGLIGFKDVNLMKHFILRKMFLNDQTMHNKKHFIVNHILQSILIDEYQERSREDIMEYFGSFASTDQKTREKKILHVYKMITGELLPHIGVVENAQICRKKALFIGDMVRRLIESVLGYRKPDDRDDYTNKYLETAGVSLGLLFRHQIRSVMKKMKTQFQKDLDQGKYVTLLQLFRTGSITTTIKRALANGDWSRKKGPSAQNQKGVAQILTNVNRYSKLSHLRRINTPLSRDGKDPKPRQLHTSHWGITCACETPEGTTCGLIKGLAQVTNVRIDTPSEPIIKLIYSFKDVVPFHESNIENEIHDISIFVNGSIVGFTSCPEVLFERLRVYKQYQDIPFNTSLLYKKGENEFHVNTVRGCPCMPLIRLDNFHKFSEIYNKYLNSQHLWTMLIEHGIIEYIDKETATNNIMIASTFDQLLKYDGYTYLEIDPNVILGVLASQIPFANRNQAPRNIYWTSMGKQAVTAPPLNHEQRCDNKIHILEYPQKPLVYTDASERLHFSELPTSQQAIVAIMCYTGYGMEDAVILNQGSIDRGLFASTFKQSYHDAEHHGPEQETFQVPPSDTISMQRGNYEKLDSETGVVKPRTFVQNNDVLIGKTISTSSLKRGQKNKTKFTRDKSTLFKALDSAVVDKVSITPNVEKEQAKLVHVRTRMRMTPQVGDKFCSMHGQKGVCGIILSEVDMPFTADGMKPDVILNPHGIPSRMTIGQLMEMLGAKLACFQGSRVNGTSFRDTTIESIAEKMPQYGFSSTGEETMYSGITGEMMKCRVFMGPLSYMRLKHMPTFKMHARNTGPVCVLSRQPQGGRSREGGLKWGEMERDTCISHGVPAVLQDRLFQQSDYYETVVCGKCGIFAEMAASKRNTYGESLNGDPEHYCRYCNTSEHVQKIPIPYAAKLLFQEMAGLHVAVRMRFVEDDRFIIEPV